MQFKLAFVTACISLLSAGTQAAAAAVEARQYTTGHLDVTTGANFTGETYFTEWTETVCFDFPVDFQDDITSIAPVDNTYCDFYAELDCPQDADYIEIVNTNPTPDVGVSYPGWDDAIKSAVCFSY